MQKVSTESRPLLFKKSNKLMHRKLEPTEKKSSISSLYANHGFFLLIPHVLSVEGLMADWKRNLRKN